MGFLNFSKKGKKLRSLLGVSEYCVLNDPFWWNHLIQIFSATQLQSIFLNALCAIAGRKKKIIFCAGECKCQNRSSTMSGWFWVNKQASVSRRWHSPSTNAVSAFHGLKGCSSPDCLNGASLSIKLIWVCSCFVFCIYMTLFNKTALLA